MNGAAPAGRPLSFATPVVSAGTSAAIALARSGDVMIAYVADSDDHRVLAVDAERLAPIASLDVGGSPDQLIVTKGGHILATLRDTNALVVIEGSGLEGSAMRIVLRAGTPSEPIGLALDPDESTVFVASGWGHALTGYSTATLQVVFSKDLGREPRAVTLSDDGKRAFVSHAVGTDVDVVDLKSNGQSKLTSLSSLECPPTTAAACGPGVPTHAGQAFALARSISPAGRLYVPHARIRTAAQFPSGYGSGEMGPTENFVVAVLDEDTGTPIPGTLDALAATSCVLPRAAVATREGELLVACVGTNEVVAMDAAAANPGQAITKRFHVPAGPVGIALDDTRPRALVWSAFDRALTWILLRGQDGLVLGWDKVPALHPLSEAVDRGRKLFSATDPRISADGRACASCHPDGRDDGNVWDTPDGPRNPPMLAGRVEDTEPYGWLGRAPDLAAHLKQTLSRLGGKGLPIDDQQALMAYVSWTKGPTVARASVPDPLALEGKQIFESSDGGCGTCHGHEGQVPDGMRHNVLSWAQGDRTGVLDTPSLRFVSGTAPYFHDGRYSSLRALLTHTQRAMGQDKKLSEHELDALEAYLRTL